ncbi:MAG TPA: T9SS type A sorting domain-containing protein [Bacteroidia bacterium]|nr:T9SS type A sorting domain-containing protein [Bacteroidia bacterium]
MKSILHLESPSVKKLVMMIILFVMLAGLGNAQNIINGDFESWPPNCPYNVAPNGWINFSTSLGPDQAGTCAGSVVSHQGNSQMNLVWYTGSNLFEGAEQTISGLSVGDVYHLGFYAINDQGLYSFGDPVILEVYVDSAVVFSTPELTSGGAWVNYSVDFTATNVSHTIGFKVNQGSTGSSGSVGVDEVSFVNLTGLNNLSYENKISIYPNPFTQTTKIRLDQKLNDASLSIYNSVGQLVKQLKNISSQEVTLQRDNLPSGMYSVHLSAGKKIVSTEKLFILDKDAQ